jgi:NADPH-dependent glutamate synthase beta subunit-like oxidoreductase
MMKTITRTDERILSADVFGRDAKQVREALGFWHEDAQDIPIYRRCQVLVVGGGPSGTAAAAAAAKQGAEGESVAGSESGGRRSSARCSRGTSKRAARGARPVTIF